MARLGRKPDAFQHYKAAWAALDLWRALRDSGPMSDAEPVLTLKRMARDSSVPARASGRYDGDAMLVEVTGLPEPKGLPLLAQIVKAAEFDLNQADAVGRAWARGDLKMLRGLDAPDGRLRNLLQATDRGRALGVRAEDDAAAAIEAALAQPGVSITALDLDAFARRGGAVDTLRAYGVQVAEATE